MIAARYIIRRSCHPPFPLSMLSAQATGIGTLPSAAIAICVILLLSQSAWAQGIADVANGSQTGPERVKVGIYVLNIGPLDEDTGSFTADFYLHFENPEHPIKAELVKEFEFMNGHADENDIRPINISDETREKKELYYRVYATFNAKVNLSRYPFDAQYLPIIIEDSNKTTKELVYEYDRNKSGYDKDKVFITGWELGNSSGNVTAHNYDVYDETYSRLEFQIKIVRPWHSAMFKFLLPVILIIFIAWITLFLKEDDVKERLTIDSSLLLAAVILHLSFLSYLPAVSYLTLADKWMISTYVILAVVLFSGIILAILTEEEQDCLERREEWAEKREMAEIFYKTSIAAITLLIIGVYALIYVMEFRPVVMEFWPMNV